MIYLALTSFMSLIGLEYPEFVASVSDLYMTTVIWNNSMNYLSGFTSFTNVKFKIKFWKGRIWLPIEEEPQFPSAGHILRHVKQFGLIWINVKIM